jgi:Na+-driven multidrug efflux pump
LYFGFLPGIISAFYAFFIGQGKTYVVTLVVFLGVAMNVVFAYLLIYGVSGYIPSLGCKGAAIATVIAQIFEIIVLAVLFFNKQNRQTFKTFKNRKFNKELFMGCIKIGLPLSFGNFIVLVSWYVIYTILGHVSRDLATVYGLGMSIYVLILFLGEGLNKAAAVITANMIGKRDLEAIKKTYKLFLSIATIFGILTAIPLSIFPECIFSLFNLLQDNIASLYSEMKMVLHLLVGIVILESVLYITSGILIAGGDTKYFATVNFLCNWVMVVLPIAVLYYLGKLNSGVIVFALTFAWCGVTAIIIYKRYKSFIWYRRLID